MIGKIVQIQQHQGQTLKSYHVLPVLTPFWDRTGIGLVGPTRGSAAGLSHMDQASSKVKPCSNINKASVKEQIR